MNVDQPPLLLLHAAAHEMAHQLGLASEDEAEFTAFLACMRAPEPAIRYSAVMLALIRCGNALHGADAERYYAIVDARYSDGMRRDLADYTAYWDAFEGPAQEIATDMNDGYLKHNAQVSGVKSYGESIDMLLALYATGGEKALFSQNFSVSQKFFRKQKIFLFFLFTNRQKQCMLNWIPFGFQIDNTVKGS